MKLTARRKISLFALALTCALAPAVQAVPAVSVMDVKLESLMPRMAEIRKSLSLNSNQQTLWQQTEAKTNTILHARETRRERLQAEIGLRMEQSGGELRDLAKLVDAEEDVSGQEGRQLRELWLTVNDALDDKQRQIAQGFLAEQLRRQAEGPREAGHEKAGREKSGGDTPKRSGMGRKGGGNAGGSTGGTQF
ncbi:MAG: hypothetical protein V4488_04195 [Pseudomonadota bacterium]